VSSTSRSGAYPIDNVDADELERLRLQHEAWAPDTAILLDKIGVGAGWKCLDLGCGPSGLTRVLADTVGSAGHVTGLEYNDAFVAEARLGAPAHVEIVQGDAYNTRLPGGSFDLVHMRFLASVAGDADRLLAEAIRLVRPGGVFACQEGTTETRRCSRCSRICWRRPRPHTTSIQSCMKPGSKISGIAPQQSACVAAIRGRTTYRPASSRPAARWSTAGSSPMLNWTRQSPTAGCFCRNRAACSSRLNWFRSGAESRAISPQLVQVWGRKPG